MFRSGPHMRNVTCNVLQCYCIIHMLLDCCAERLCSCSDPFHTCDLCYECVDAELCPSVCRSVCSKFLGTVFSPNIRSAHPLLMKLGAQCASPSWVLDSRFSC
uniref:Uncharacterized protein n=1 Tax=Cacopsylla melanoneura TaxID=428564 RepID=A0A8D8Q3D0_9HEMI